MTCLRFVSKTTKTKQKNMYNPFKISVSIQSYVFNNAPCICNNQGKNIEWKRF